MTLVSPWSRLRNLILSWGDWLSDRVSLAHSSLIVGTVTTGLVLLLQPTGALQPLELLAFDQLVGWQTQPYSDPRLLVVAITEGDLQAQQRWPIDDGTLAQTLQTLQQYQPKVIGLDLYRDLATPPGSRALQASLAAPNIIGIQKLPDPATERVLPPPTLPRDRIGFNDFVVDPDGVVRRNFLYARLPSGSVYSLALRLALAYLGVDLDPGPSVPSPDPRGPLPLPSPLKIGQNPLQQLRPYSGGYARIDTTGYQTLIDYRTALVAEQVTLSQVLGGEIQESQVRDRIVLVGTTAPSIQSAVLTPYSATTPTNPYEAGVLLQAQLTSKILQTVDQQQPILSFLPLWLEYLWIGSWGWLGSALVMGCYGLGSLFAGGVLAGLSLSGLSMVAFHHNVWVPWVAPELSLGLAMVGMALYRAIYTSFHDVLTGLPNRVRFLDALRYRLQDSNQPDPPGVAVLFVALNRFGLVNDTFGYGGGDRLLLQVRDQVKTYLHPPYTLARVGGDEFGVMLPYNPWDTSSQQVIQLAEAIKHCLEQPFSITNAKQSVRINTSIGIAFAQADGTYNAEDLLRDAHAAMYRAKVLGRSHYEVFAVGLHAELTRRMDLEFDLRQALDRNELKVYYQPIWDLRLQQLAGFEALVRWWHPQDGFMSPSEFVTVAEESGLIIPLDQWVLEEACGQLQLWRSKLGPDLPLILNVNLSTKQFSGGNLVTSVAQILERTGLPGHYLKLEITERVAMDHEKGCIDIMLALKELDIQLSLDDFGTGYSSLSYLCSFPVDTLKIDYSFVSRLTQSDADRIIVKTIINLSHDLGINVTAEGIETQEQLRILQQWNCDYGQGYFFSKPLDAAGAEQWIVKG
ncbi:putative bifunctional diguanylate cyclase/phosphodiesterase [Prochlorothrix hollandica]|uniref:putative bifunctional diguanylate cyclase/phosphodiesterase n=1 Tax=Prochlorothrix hollandica TaxID=1223 RepID=UPI000345C001|nr:EAL domain-containing protein [Prochlorothrix hollandica]